MHLPALSTDYKFDNWTGEDEILPDEEDEYRDKLSRISCFYLKGWGERVPGADWETGVLSERGYADGQAFRKLSVEDLTKLRIRIPVKPELREFQRVYFERNNVDLNDEDSLMFFGRTFFHENFFDYMPPTAKLSKTFKEFEAEVNQQIENLVLAHVDLGTCGRFREALVAQQEVNADCAKEFKHGRFPMKNNIGATCKYAIVDGSSQCTVRMMDEGSQEGSAGSSLDLYLHFEGRLETSENTPIYFKYHLNFQQDEICFRLRTFYWSTEKYCALHKAFYM